MLTAFREDIAKRKLPSLLSIEKFKSQNKVLRQRNAVVIKTWIHNQFRKKAKLSLKADDEITDDTNKDTCREDIKSIFASYINRKIIPSINECVIAYKSKALQKFCPTDIQDMILREIHYDF